MNVGLDERNYDFRVLGTTHYIENWTTERVFFVFSPYLNGGRDGRVTSHIHALSFAIEIHFSAQLSPPHPRQIEEENWS